MTESVVITPTVGNDSNGDPVEQGAPVELVPWEIAPGNMAGKYGPGGDFTDVEFTVFLPLRSCVNGTWRDTSMLVKNGDEIQVRGKRCTAWVELWQPQQRSSFGGVVILARSKSGKAA